MSRRGRAAYDNRSGEYDGRQDELRAACFVVTFLPTVDFCHFRGATNQDVASEATAPSSSRHPAPTQQSSRARNRVAYSNPTQPLQRDSPFASDNAPIFLASKEKENTYDGSLIRLKESSMEKRGCTSGDSDQRGLSDRPIWTSFKMVLIL
ncbi:hypothetical protein CEXT_515751 [Caerostris extrusa]|uniref:Uncharacterized protein n=1 Tax=Caerostris extrusa TaxID=172846 RepID=A0AAV4T1L7_CAEEX|nr:hypothetical protein CEXT_515751 [Caerostris extrusa]